MHYESDCRQNRQTQYLDVVVKNLLPDYVAGSLLASLAKLSDNVHQSEQHRHAGLLSSVCLHHYSLLVNMGSLNNID